MPLRRTIGKEIKQPVPPEHPAEPAVPTPATTTNPLLSLLIERAPKSEQEEYIKVLQDIKDDTTALHFFRARVEKLKQEWKNVTDSEIYNYLATYFKLLQVMIMDRHDMRPPPTPEKFNFTDYCNVNIIKSELHQMAKLWDINIKEVRDDLDIKRVCPFYYELM
jgi:hypothetical protein